MRSFLVRLLKNRIIRRIRAMLYHNICLDAVHGLAALIQTGRFM